METTTRNEGTRSEERERGTLRPPPPVGMRIAGAERRRVEISGWEENGERRGVAEERLARGLGWFSLGLGIAEVTAPARVARLAGATEEHMGAIRLLGLREIAHGIGILAQRRPAMGVWSRVGGDAVDLAFLGAAFRSPDSNKARLAASTMAILGIAALDGLVAGQLSSPPSETTESGAVRVRRSITIGRSPEELYRFWRSFENLPRFMEHLESVQATEPLRSHWVAQGPGGASVEWDAEVVEDRPNELIAWRALGGSDVYHTGSVRFEKAPGDRGTMVRVELEYDPPGGFLGAGVARLMGKSPGQLVDGDLRRFKQIMETGEVVRSEATLEGVGTFEQRPGQPPTPGTLDDAELGGA